jgi:hypothetical protein
VGPATPARGSGPEKLPFTSDTIKEIVRAKQPDIERCWEQTLAGTDKPVDGKLQTHFVITPVGSVKQAKVVKKGTTLKDPALHRCVETVLSTMLFPRPPTGRTTRWSTPSISRPCADAAGAHRDAGAGPEHRPDVRPRAGRAGRP